MLRPASAGLRFLRAAPAAPATLLPLIACFTLGALALLSRPGLPAASTLAMLAVPALLPWRGRSPWAAFVLGFVLAHLRASELLVQRWPVERLGETLSVQGSIVTLPEASASGDSDTEAGSEPTRTWRFLFAPNDPALPPRIRVSWYRSAVQLQGGDCWRLTLRLRTPHGSLNPGGFDYEGWLFRQGVTATATVREGEACGAAEGQALLRLRQRLANRIGDWLPAHPALPLVLALAIGDTSGLTDEDWQAFRLTGTTHLVAISGFNVAIVASLAFFLLRWAWSLWPALCLRLPAQRFGYVGSALAAVLYALLAGFDPPVARAAFMLVFLLIAGWFGGLARAAQALAVAWVIIIAVDPLALLTPGLWLSFGAVAAIFYFGSGRLGRLPAWRAALQMQWMLSLVLAPLTLFWFQGTSLLGPLVNLVAVPVAALLTPALLIALLLSSTLPVLGLPLLRAVAAALEYGAAGLDGLAQHSPQAWLAASPAPAAVLLALLGALLLFAPTGLPVRVLGVLGFSALLLPPGRAPRQDFELAVLDVGQGLAVVVRTAEHSLLFDAGPASPDGFDAGSGVVVPYLLANGVRRLDRLIVSHRDLDHRGGVPAVRAAIRVEDEIGALSARPCRDGDAWTWDGVRFELLGGPAEGLSTNDGGCVLRVSSARLSALLPADIEAAGEARLLAAHAAALQSDVLISPHHGSRTSSSAAFIAAVQPELVIHSAGWHHRFGHPAPAIVARYAELLPEVRQQSTGDAGALLVRPGMNGPDVMAWREQQGRLWSTPGDEAWRRPRP